MCTTFETFEWAWTRLRRPPPGTTARERPGLGHRMRRGEIRDRRLRRGRCRARALESVSLALTDASTPSTAGRRPDRPPSPCRRFDLAPPRPGGIPPAFAAPPPVSAMVTSAVAWWMPGTMSRTLRRGHGHGRSDADEAVDVAQPLGGTPWSIDFGVRLAATLPVPGGYSPRPAASPYPLPLLTAASPVEGPTSRVQGGLNRGIGIRQTSGTPPPDARSGRASHGRRGDALPSMRNRGPASVIPRTSPGNSRSAALSDTSTQSTSRAHGNRSGPSPEAGRNRRNSSS